MKALNQQPNGASTMTPHFTAAKITHNGKPAAELAVRGTTAKDHASLRTLLDALGYGPASGMDNARRIVCTTKAEVDAARGPLAKFFDEKGNFQA
jgi:hypothetical protein